jgi:DNA-binding transcriptional MocR family regulator
LQGFYRERKEILMGALERSFPDGTWFSNPSGGLFTWGKLPGGLDSRVLLSKAVAQTRVAYVPGEPFIVEADGRPFLRLTFAKEPPEKLVAGAEKLGELFRAELG